MSAHWRLANRLVALILNSGLTISSDLTQLIIMDKWRMYSTSKAKAGLPLPCKPLWLLVYSWLFTAARFSRLIDTGWSLVKGHLREPLLAKVTSRSEEHTSELQSLMSISYAV